MQVLLQDLRQALHQLRKNTGFALSVIVALSLGTSATGTVFSLAYGLLSFLTSQRIRESRVVRAALGANRRNVIRMVTRQARMFALIGMAAGVPLVFAAGCLAKQELINTSHFDPVFIFAAVAVLLLLAVAVTWLPARGASRIDPVKAMRAK